MAATGNATVVADEMKMPPYDDPNWHDTLHAALGVVLTAAVLGVAWWIATTTGVARSRP